jgi:uncharacterized protein YggT (Ycf19 family)
MEIVTPPPSSFLMTLANIAATLLSLYSLLIWIRIILTWIRVPGSQWNGGGNPFVNFLSKIVDPYLNLFQGFTALKRSHIDFTPLVAMAVLSIVQSLLRIFGAYGRLTLGLALGLVVKTLWSYIFSLFFWFFMAMLAIRLIFCYRRAPIRSNTSECWTRCSEGSSTGCRKCFSRKADERPESRHHVPDRSHRPVHHRRHRGEPGRRCVGETTDIGARA